MSGVVTGVFSEETVGVYSPEACKTVGSWQSSVGSLQSAVGSPQLTVGSRQLAVFSQVLLARARVYDAIILLDIL